MKSLLSWISALAFVLMATFFIPVERFFNQFTNPDEIVEALHENHFYEKTLRVFAHSISANETLQQFKGTPLEISDHDATQILERSFPTEWFIGVVRTLHGRVVGLLNNDPIQPALHLELRDRKALVVEETLQLLNHRMNAMPECSPQVMQRKLARFGRAPQDLQDLIGDCRPPERFRIPVMNRLRGNLETMVNVMPDTLRILSQGRADDSSVWQGLRPLESIAVDLRWAGYAVLIFLLSLIAALHLRRHQTMVRRIGWSLTCAGTIISALSGMCLWLLRGGLFSRSLIPFSNEVPPEGLIGLLSELSDAMLKDYCRDVLVTGLLLLFAGIVLTWFAAHRLRDDADPA